MFWYLIILSLMLVPMSIASVGYCKNLNLNQIILIYSLIPLFLFMAFRDSSVGADTMNYCAVFEQITDIDFGELQHTHLRAAADYELELEYGYVLYNKLVGCLISFNHTIIVTNSLFIIILLWILVSKNSKYPFVSVWLYITLGIFQTNMNMARNAIAILLCYNAFGFIKEKKLFKYCLTIGLASLFHGTSLLFLPLYFLVNYIKLDKKRVIWFFCIAMIGSAFFVVARPYIVSILPYRYKHYVLESNTKFEALIVGVFHLILVGTIYFFSDKNRRNHLFNDISVGTWAFIFDISFFMLGFNLSAATRLAALFSVYFIIYIPNMLFYCIENKKKRAYVMALIIAMCGAEYIMRISLNNIGSTMPYVFFV